MASNFEIGNQWNQYASEHFLIYSRPDIPNKYIREFTRQCEHRHHLISQRLGLSRPNFWAEKAEVKIFIYQTRQDYLQNAAQLQQPEQLLSTRKKIINTFYFEQGFFDAILPNKLAKIILKDLIGDAAEVPFWFSEGIACAEEKQSVLRYLLPLKGLIGKGRYLAVSDLEKIDPRETKTPDNFYASAASLVIFLLEDYSEDNFIQLCRELRDGNSFYEAMGAAYDIKDAQELNEKFLAFLSSKSYDDIANSKGFKAGW